MTGLESALAPLILLVSVALVVRQRRRLVRYERDDRD
jgi:hypothetical protein